MCIQCNFFFNRSENIGWTPAKSQHTLEQSPSGSEAELPEDSQHSDDDISSPVGRRMIEEKLRKKIYVEHFPGKPGAILDNEEQENYGFTAYAHSNNIYSPFLSEIDWKVAQWAKLRGPGSTAVSELLSIPQVSAMYFNYISSHLNVVLASRKAWPILS